MKITMDLHKIEPIKSIEEYLDFYSKSSTKNFFTHSRILPDFILKYPENRIGNQFKGYNLNPAENKTLSELIYLSLYAKKSISILAAIPTDDQQHNFNIAFLFFKKKCKNLFEYNMIQTTDKYWIKLNPVILNSILLQWKVRDQIFPLYFN